MTSEKEQAYKDRIEYLHSTGFRKAMQRTIDALLKERNELDWSYQRAQHTIQVLMKTIRKLEKRKK